MDKKQIENFFAPYEIDILNIHHLYIEIDHEKKTSKFQINYIPVDYMTMDYINYLYKSINIMDEEETDLMFKKVRQLGLDNSIYIDYLIDNNLLLYNSIPEFEDSYECVLEFLKKYNLLTEMSKWDGSDYIGKRFDDYYILYSHHRDSKIYEESNYHSLIKLCEKMGIKYIEINSNHWAVGWVEQIAIHEEDYLSIEKANDPLEQLKEYPLVDEADYESRIDERREEIEKEIKGDLKSKFENNNMTFPEKKKYAKETWHIDLEKTGSIREKARELAEEE
jgi:hypothetical protein